MRWLATLGRLPVYEGAFRLAPLHNLPPYAASSILSFAAAKPEHCGFPGTTCVVNTTLFLPSIRSRSAGITVFGSDRGCKTIVVPRTATGQPLDRLDVALIRPVFSRNPSVSTVYLDKDCEPVAQEIAAVLAGLEANAIRTLILPGWSDAVAIHRVAMACKRLHAVDCYGHLPPNGAYEWHDARSVQAFTTLIEMHPTLKEVRGGPSFLQCFQTAVTDSRCKHNVALIESACPYDLVLVVAFTALVLGAANLAGMGAERLVLLSLADGSGDTESPAANYAFFARYGVVAVIAASVMYYLQLSSPSKGLAWTYFSAYVMVAHGRLSLLLRRRGANGASAVVPTAPSAAKTTAAPSPRLSEKGRVVYTRDRP